MHTHALFTLHLACTDIRSVAISSVAISSELSLNIYLLTLSDDRMSDNDLLTAISETPPNVRFSAGPTFLPPLTESPCPYRFAVHPSD